MVGEWFNDHMHMRWHDAPRCESVALAIAMQQALLDDLCDVGLSQQSRTMTAVELGVCPTRPAQGVRESFRRGAKCILKAEHDVLNEPCLVAVGQISARSPTDGAHVHHSAAMAGNRKCDAGEDARAP